MQTQDSQLREIHQENKQVKKKLEMFRSGLEKLMNKKSISKKQPLQRHQPPSHDNIANSQLKYQQQNKFTPFKTSPYNFQSPSPSQPQQQFGFNSTLFRQINDDTVLSNTSSSNVFIGGVQVGNNNSNNNQLQEGKNISYFDSSNNKSITIPPINFNISNQHQPSQQQPQQQPFRKSSMLFKQIDQLMSKVNKSTKLPIKPIQKYINKQEFQEQARLVSDRGDSMMEIQLTLSSSRVETNLEDAGGRSGRGKVDVGKEVNVNVNKPTMRKDTLLKQANDFLKSMRQKSSSLTLQPGKPPLPQQMPIPKPITTTSHSNKNKASQQPLRIQTQVPIIKQPITRKIKQTLNQRKKLMMRQQAHQKNKIIVMDDSIELQLSSQDEKQQQANSKTQGQIQQLIQQRRQLLEQLQLVQKQLQQLQQQQ